MTKLEVKKFIEKMKSIGDEWTMEQVMDVYGELSLSEAIISRKNSIDQLVSGLRKSLVTDR